MEQIGFGCVSGVVGIWDLRENKQKPSLLSEPDNSHFEAITDLMWLSSKGGNEFVTTSTDGTVKWWDSRNLNAPADLLFIKEN